MYKIFFFSFFFFLSFFSFSSTKKSHRNSFLDVYNFEKIYHATTLLISEEATAGEIFSKCVVPYDVNLLRKKKWGDYSLILLVETGEKLDILRFKNSGDKFFEHPRFKKIFPKGITEHYTLYIPFFPMKPLLRFDDETIGRQLSERRDFLSYLGNREVYVELKDY